MAKATTTTTTTTTTPAVMSAEKLKYLAEKKAASEAAYAAYRKAHPLPEVVEGSPYQMAREEWAKGGAEQLDHWTARKD